MSAPYTQFLVADTRGRILDEVQWTKGSYNQAVDKVGTLSLDISPRMDARLLKRGNWIVPMRAPWHSPLAPNGGFLITRRKQTLSRSGTLGRSVSGIAPRGLLSWRLVDDHMTAGWSVYPELNPRAYLDSRGSKHMPADDMVKSFMDESVGMLATQWVRYFSQWNFYTEKRYGLAAWLAKAVSPFANLSQVLDDIVKQARQELLPFDLYYDVLIDGWNDEFALRGATWVNCRGLDYGLSSERPLVLYPSSSAQEVVMDENGEREITTVFVSGGDPITGANGMYFMDNLDATSAFEGNRREKSFQTSRQFWHDILAEAKKSLAENKTEEKTFVVLRDSPQLAVGRHIGLGDRCVLAWGGELIEQEIKVVNYNLSRSEGESVDARLEPPGREDASA